MKICLIYNKNSASGNKLIFIKKIYQEIKKTHQIDLFETTNENQAAEIIKTIKNQNYKRLIIAGGDGSVSFAVNEIIKNNINIDEDFAIGYIPAGTANILQAELGMTKNINKISKILISNDFYKVNLVQINEKYFILMAGVGWDAQIVQSINSKIKKILGKIIFAIKGLEKFIFLNNQKIKITFENNQIDADWILCQNSRFYAGHYKINNTSIFDNQFTTYIFKDLTRIKLLYYIYLIFFYGNLNKSNSVIIKHLKKIEFYSQDYHIPVQIDGDYFGSFKNIRISESNKSVNLLRAS